MTKLYIPAIQISWYRRIGFVSEKQFAHLVLDTTGYHFALDVIHFLSGKSIENEMRAVRESDYRSFVPSHVFCNATREFGALCFEHGRLILPSSSGRWMNIPQLRGAQAEETAIA